MPCAQCGTANPPGTKFCSNCGTPTSPQTQAQAPAGVVAGAGAPATISVDFRRLGTGDIIAGIGTLLVFISVFLPWYTVGGFSGSLTDAGGWRILILILAIITLLYLFIRTLSLQNVRLPIAHWQLLTGLVGLQFLLTLLAFLVKPGGGDVLGDNFSVGWGWGAFVGLIVALVALAGGVLRKNEPENIVPGAPRARVSSLMPTSLTTATTAAQPVAPQAGTGPGCARCGTPLTPGTAFCTNCGAPVSG
jgi:MFS family permease